jgi:hypothetical protein
VANLTASRISLKNMRKLRLFQRDAYIHSPRMGRASRCLCHSKERQSGYSV